MTSARTTPSNAWRTALIVVAAAIALGLASAARMLTLYRAISPADAILSGLLDWGTWLPFVPFVFLASKRLPLGRERPFVRVVVHTLIAFVLSFAQAFTFAAITAAIRSSDLSTELRSALLVKLHAGVFVYWALLLGLNALAAWRALRANELLRAESARQLAEARFAALEGHLRPHFLFNTLNSIASYVRSEPDKAEAMIAKLGALLRKAVAGGEGETTLSDELDFVRDYLDIERARFGERLKVVFTVDDECEAALVPRFVLQPLVENAVQHGIAPEVDGGTVEVSAAASNGSLQLRVADDGAGHEGSPATGFGLAAVRDRLALLHGERASLSSVARPQGGTVVELSLPLRRGAPS